MTSPMVEKNMVKTGKKWEPMKKLAHPIGPHQNKPISGRRNHKFHPQVPEYKLEDGDRRLDGALLK